MTRDDIIRMAGKCGLWARSVVIMNDDVLGIGHPTEWPELEQFAALVAAAEREACAKVCEDLDTVVQDGSDSDWTVTRSGAFEDAADAIRKRGAL